MDVRQEIRDFASVLERDGILTGKPSQAQLEVIQQICDFTKEEYRENAGNRSVVIIYNEYHDWRQSYIKH